MKLVGHAAVFSEQSEDLGGFREVIEPGAFAETLRSGRNVFALFGHDSNRVLGSTRSGSLKLSEDSTGLRFELDLSKAKTADATTVHELVRAGDLSAMSFGFRIPDKRGAEQWKEDGRDLVRHVREVELLEISPVAFPAYPQTDLMARSVTEAMRSDIAKREAVQQAARQRSRQRKRIKLAEAHLHVTTAPPEPVERIRARAKMKRRELASR